MSAPVLAGVAQGFRYVLASQLLVLLLGLLKAFAVPALLSVANFGYWQLYVFYTTYVGVFSLGFNDGLYLRYGGKELKDLPLDRIRPAVRIYAGVLLVMALAVAWVFSDDADPNRRIVMALVAANIVVMGILAIFSQLLQATNQFRRFSLFNAADKVFFLILLPGLIVLKIDSFTVLAAADLTAKVCLLGVFLVLHPEFIQGPKKDARSTIDEYFENVRAGIPLMIANVCGMLVLGAGRIVVEYFDTLDNYAYYAFGVAMTNLVLVGITALSVVSYPVLKRLSENDFFGYYNSANRKLFLFNCVMLLVYFPVVYVIDALLPKYQPVVPYLAVLFAITALQAKMQLLNNTFYKALRRESDMLLANASSLVIAVVLAAAGYAWTRSVEAIAWAALLTMIYRVYASERGLRCAMGGGFDGFAGYEAIALLVFLASTSLLPRVAALMSLALLLGGCLVLMRAELRSLLRLAKGGGR